MPTGDPPNESQLGGVAAGPGDGGEERGGGLHRQPAVVGCQAGEAARQLGQLRHGDRGQVQPRHLQRVGSKGPDVSHCNLHSWYGGPIRWLWDANPYSLIHKLSPLGKE